MHEIPLDPFPTFLGIKFDPKLCFKNLLENINARASSKINLIRRIKGLRLKNSRSLCKIIFKNFIRSIFDYAFIPLSSSTERISSDLQVLQNKILKHIKYFPFKTKIIDIHKQFKIDLVDTRSKKLLTGYLNKRANHQQLIQDLESYRAITEPLNPKFYSLMEIFNNLFTI